MKLEFLGKDPSSNPDDCPSLFSTDQDSYIVQGWIVTDDKFLATLHIHEDESIVEIPATVMGHLEKDGVRGKITRIQAPIVHVTNDGDNYIVKGARVHDAEALSQMVIPDYETCVEVPKAALRALIDGA